MRYSVVSSVENQVIVPRSIPPVFLRKPPPFTKGRLCCRFLGLLFVTVIWCKQVVYVQTCGLHRRSMNAPTMLIYKCIYLWPTKINHGYTVGATIGRLISNYLNCFSSINQQLKQTANSPSLSKGGWCEHLASTGRVDWKSVNLCKIANQINRKISSLSCTCSVVNQHFKLNEPQGSLW